MVLTKPVPNRIAAAVASAPVDVFFNRMGGFSVVNDLTRARRVQERRPGRALICYATPQIAALVSHVRTTRSQDLKSGHPFG